jgi:hypothetical protein
MLWAMPERADPGRSCHRVLELQAVLGLVDGLGRGADQLDLVLVQHAVAPQVQRAVQRGLAAHGGQDGVGASLAMIFSTVCQVMGSM